MTLKDSRPPQGFHVLISIARTLQAYFIINNRIYQSPDMYTVLSNRLARQPVSNSPISLMLTVAKTLADVALFPGIVTGHPAQV